MFIEVYTSVAEQKAFQLMYLYGITFKCWFKLYNCLPHCVNFHLEMCRTATENVDGHQSCQITTRFTDCLPFIPRRRQPVNIRACKINIEMYDCSR